MSEETKTLKYWMGKPITELSREELLQVIEEISPIYFLYFNPTEIKTRAIGSMEMIKRGER